MKIDVELYEQIRELYVHEKLSQRQIATKLGVSRTTVRKYCKGDCVPGHRKGISGRYEYVITAEIRSFIEECLEEDRRTNISKQKHTAERIHARLVTEKNFTGGKSTVRKVVAELRQKIPKVFIPLSYELAEAAQIDWGEATVILDGERIKVQLFCMRLCYSAAIFVKAYYRQNEESFLDGNVSGFEYFGGIPKFILFDNAKVAVKEGFGAHAKPQQRYHDLSAHYAFKPEFCNIASGHEKGLVEGLVGWIRRNHLVPAPKVHTIEELNELLFNACQKYLLHQIRGKKHAVGEMFLQEKSYLTPLPSYPFDTSRIKTVKVDQFATIRFDYNHYSVPIIHAGKTVSVKGYGNHVDIYFQHSLIASHWRAYTRNETYYELEHYMPLIEQRPRSVYHAKPVKSSVTDELFLIGERLDGPREMVKLLRLCLEQGESNVIRAANNIGNQELTVEKIKARMNSTSKRHKPVHIDTIEVRKVQLNQYDTLLNGEKKWTH